MVRSDEMRMDESATRVIASVREATEPALEAVRQFVDTVNDVFPDLEEAPRRRVIEAGFKMTEDLVRLSTRFAEKVVKAGTPHEERHVARKAA